MDAAQNKRDLPLCESIQIATAASRCDPGARAVQCKRHAQVKIKEPYLLFLGDAPDTLAAKVAYGIRHWRPDKCVGQLRLEGCRADTGLPDLTLAQATEAEVATLVVGVANRGGVIADSWVAVLLEALDSGMDIAAGLHDRLADVPALAERATQLGQRILDVRHPRQTFPIGDGKPRSGHRLLTVGTDCSVGKMYTSLAFEEEMKGRGIPTDFRATGQTGILIAGEGVAIDAVVADFIAGATEWLTPAADTDHWDVVEGQGSLFHPSYAGVSLGLLHGAQPDVLVMCHESTRTHLRGLPGYKLPNIVECIDANLSAARLTNPAARIAGVAVNTSALDDLEATRILEDIESQTGLPTVDPVRQGVARLVDELV